MTASLGQILTIEEFLKLSDVEESPAVEIISPSQSFGEMVEKTTAYLTAGVLRVWVVDTQGQSITVFYPDRSPQTYTGETALSDPLVEGLDLSAFQVFQKAGLTRP